MRMILVGAMVAAVAMTGPAFGGMNAADGGAPSQVGGVNYTNPSGRVIEEHEHGAGAEFGMAVASSVMSLIYTPFRFVYGVVGAGLGGFAGWSTGGDMRTAKGIWRPTAEGRYYIRPDYLESREEAHEARLAAQHPQPQQPTIAEAPPSQPIDSAPYEGTPEDPM